MRKVVFQVLAIAIAIVQAKAGNGGKPRKFTPAQVNQVSRLVRPQEQTVSGKSLKPGEYGQAFNRLRAKKAPAYPNAVQDNISITTLGESVNPLTVNGNGKTNLFAHPALNTVTFVRRGGPTDPGGTSGAPGNKLFYDLNTRGGGDGFWQISKGPIFDNELYDLIDNNHAPRYPQGLIWAPPGSTDTSQAVLFAQMPVLDGTNGIWGGLGRAWQPLASPQPAPKQTLASSNSGLLHYVGEGMDVSSNGKIFFVDPERDASGTEIVYNNRVLVYSMAYNSLNNGWDTTLTLIPFNATNIASSALAFGPDGTSGYIVILATSPDYGVTNVFAPFVSKTTDGGLNWSEFRLVNLNPDAGSCVDSLRNNWLGSWVNFQGDGSIIPVLPGSDNSHKVQYSTTFDLDITVDKFNYCHIMTAMAVAGFTDTLEAANPPTIRSGLGQWLTDICLNDPYFPSGFVFDQVKALRGCWGDCAGTERLIEDNRPQTTRTWDGSILGFCYFDTDTSEFDPEPAGGNPNSNPDLWVRLLRVEGPGQYRLTSQVRNKTKGSNIGGQVICGNVSPYMLPSPTADSSFLVPVSAILLSTFDGTVASWPVTHLYLDGITISGKRDTFPVKANPCIIISAEELVRSVASLGLVLAPNPSVNSVFATLYSPTLGSGKLSVTNALGQLVERKSLQILAGDTRIPINISAYKPGIYFLNVSVGDQRISKRFVKE